MSISKKISPLLLITFSSYSHSKSTLFSEWFIDNSYYDDQEITLIFTGRTFHLGSRNRNENNDIFGIGYKGFEVSTMNNSFYDRSYIFSYNKKWFWKDWIDLGLRVGGITGYKKEDNPVQLVGVTPLFSPTVTIHYQGFGLETALQADVLVFSLNYSF